MNYYKLKETTRFKVNKHWGYKWKKWDEVERRMVVSENYEQGFSKRHELDVTTDQGDGKLEVSQMQFASMLEGVARNGESNIIGTYWTVKTNGKEGKDIRYYINPVKSREEPKEEIKADDLPF